VLVVDDSLVCRELLSEFLNQAPDIEVVGTASNGKEAIVLNRKLLPDLITMDVQMPGLDGFATIEEIMTSVPVPILVVTSSPGKEGGEQTLKALSVGALDLVEKPELDGSLVDKLREKVRLLAGIRVVHRARKKPKRTLVGPSTAVRHQRPIIGIASSTGGPKVLLDILSALPRDFPSCILVTQHIPKGFGGGLATWLDREVALDVKSAEENDNIRPGLVLIAPTGQHLILRTPTLAALSDAPPINGLRPSGTLMLSSIAETCGSSAIGIILSGMGSDGAEGLLELRRSGGICLAQDESSSLVFGMPKAAIELGAVDKVLDVPGILDFLLRGGP
jgi:two-component system chemotaxis response regulator CheB